MMKMGGIRDCHLLLVLLAPGLSSAFSMVHQGETQQVNMITHPQKLQFSFNLMIFQFGIEIGGVHLRRGACENCDGNEISNSDDDSI